MENKNIPPFWYESNACWGNVTCFQELKEKLNYQLKAPNVIRNIDDFLNFSKQCKYSIGNNFGTKSEHIISYSLKMYLSDNELLESFLDFCKIEG